MADKPTKEQAVDALALALARFRVSADGYDPFDPTGFRGEADRLRDIFAKLGDVLPHLVTHDGTREILIADIEHAAEYAVSELEDAADEFAEEQRSEPSRWSPKMEKFV